MADSTTNTLLEPHLTDNFAEGVMHDYRPMLNEPVLTSATIPEPSGQQEFIKKMLALKEQLHGPMHLRHGTYPRPFDYYTQHIKNTTGNALSFWDTIPDNLFSHNDWHVDGVLFTDGEIAFSDDAPDHLALSEARRKVEAGRLQIHRYNPTLLIHGNNPKTLDAITAYVKRNVSKPQIIPVRLAVYNRITDEDLYADDVPVDMDTVMYEGILSNFKGFNTITT